MAMSGLNSLTTLFDRFVGGVNVDPPSVDRVKKMSVAPAYATSIPPHESMATTGLVAPPVASVRCGLNVCPPSVLRLPCHECPGSTSAPPVRCLCLRAYATVDLEPGGITWPRRSGFTSSLTRKDLKPKEWTTSASTCLRRWRKPASSPRPRDGIPSRTQPPKMAPPIAHC